MDLGQGRPRSPSFYALDLLRAMTGKVPDLGIIFEWQILLPLFGLAALALVPALYTRLRGRGTSP